MAGNLEGEIGYEQGVALANLTKTLSRHPPTYGELTWICRVHRVPGWSDLARKQAHIHIDNDDLLVIAESAYASGHFAGWFADVLEPYLKGIRQELWRHTPDRSDAELAQVAWERVIKGEVGWNASKRALNILGFELVLGRDMFDVKRLVIVPTVGGQQRAEELSKLRSLLGQKHPQALVALQGAYEAYIKGGSDAMRHVVEASRNALENVVRDVTHQDLGPGLQTLNIDDERRRNFLLRFRDFVGVEGPHGDDQPSEEDATLTLRTAEEVMVWVMKRAREW